jgi:hypothetical protein
MLFERLLADVNYRGTDSSVMCSGEDSEGGGLLQLGVNADGVCGVCCVLQLHWLLFRGK